MYIGSRTWMSALYPSSTWMRLSQNTSVPRLVVGLIALCRGPGSVIVRGKARKRAGVTAHLPISSRCGQRLPDKSRLKRRSGRATRTYRTRALCLIWPNTGSTVVFRSPNSFRPPSLASLSLIFRRKSAITLTFTTRLALPDGMHWR